MFSIEEEVLIVSFFIENASYFNAPFNQCVTKAGKKRRWEILTEKLNSQSTSAVYTAEQVRKKFRNISNSARTKIREMKNPPTGGGKRSSKLTVAEQQYADFLQSVGSDIISGISGGIDTGESTMDCTESPEQQQDAEPLNFTDAAVVPESCCEEGNVIIIENPCTGLGAVPKDKKKNQYDELVKLEIERAKLEISVLKLKEEKLKLEIEKLKIN